MQAIYIGRVRKYFRVLDSTNNYASSIAGKYGISEGTIVRAGYQMKGRGQAENSWESHPGKNLTLSLILYPRFLPPDKQFYLSEIVSLGIADFLQLYLEEVKIKWPNDIYAGSKKLGGILIEHAITGNVLDYTVAGIGLNVNQVVFDPGLPNPASIKSFTGTDLKLEHCIDLLCPFLEHWYEMLKAGAYQKIMDRYHERIYRFMSWQLFRDKDGPFEARIMRVEATGPLVLEDRKGNRRIYGFREVEFID